MSEKAGKEREGVEPAYIHHINILSPHKAVFSKQPAAKCLCMPNKYILRAKHNATARGIEPVRADVAVESDIQLGIPDALCGHWNPRPFTLTHIDMEKMSVTSQYMRHSNPTICTSQPTTLPRGIWHQLQPDRAGTRGRRSRPVARNSSLPCATDRARCLSHPEETMTG